MDNLEKKKMEKLYELLECLEKQKEKNEEQIAALKWAIYELENK